jgi:acetyl esterase/lipase
MTRKFTFPVTPIVLLGILAFVVPTPPMARAAEAEPPVVQHTERIYKVVGDAKLTMHIFAREGAQENTLHPAIVFIHGGGWAFGEPSDFFAACLRYAGMGFTSFSVQYRLAENADGDIPSPKLTPIECVKDVRSALRWVRGNAGEFAIDPNRIVVGGHSVGGQLSLSTVLCDGINEESDNLTVSPAANALLLYSGTPDTIEGWCDYLLADRRKQIWSISPAHNVKPGMPPAIAFHGTDDHVVPYWRVLRLKKFMDEAGTTISPKATRLTRKFWTTTFSKRPTRSCARLASCNREVSRRQRNRSRRRDALSSAFSSAHAKRDSDRRLMTCRLGILRRRGFNDKTGPDFFVFKAIAAFFMIVVTHPSCEHHTCD